MSRGEVFDDPEGDAPVDRALSRSSRGLLTAVLVTIAPGSSGQAPDRQRKSAAETAPLAVTVGQIAASPARFYGREVQVQSEIDSLTNPHVFTLDGDQPGVDPDVLVFVPEPDRELLVAEAPVTVIGTVRRFDWTELSDQYHWLELTPDLRGAFDSRPVIVARSVRVAERGGQAPQP
jgi:hypothetical protein